jgi:hypothetical protein
MRFRYEISDFVVLFSMKAWPLKRMLGEKLYVNCYFISSSYNQKEIPQRIDNLHH